jgi:hypothetical protein
MGADQRRSIGCRSPSPFDGATRAALTAGGSNNIEVGTHVGALKAGRGCAGSREWGSAERFAGRGALSGEPRDSPIGSAPGARRHRQQRSLPDRLRDQIKLGCYRKDECAEQQIDSEDVLLPLTSMQAIRRRVSQRCASGRIGSMSRGATRASIFRCGQRSRLPAVRLR